MIFGQSIDILLEKAITEILLSQYTPSPRGNVTKEIIAQTLVLGNPRARICTTRFRNVHLPRLIGRFLWEASGSDSLEVISYYDSGATKFAKGNRIPSAYGKRLLSYGKNSLDQIGRAVHTLKADNDSRRGYGCILTPLDSPTTTGEYPCITGFQTLIRNNKLLMIVFVRSSSIWGLLPTDAFLFTMLQELMANELGVDMDSCVFMIGSAHFYGSDLAAISQIAERGILGIPYEMGPFFTTHNPGIPALIAAETEIRKGKSSFDFPVGDLVKYKDEDWAQFIHTLIVYKNILEKSSNISGLPSFIALKTPYKTMVERIIPSELMGSGVRIKDVSPTAIRDNKWNTEKEPRVGKPNLKKKKLRRKSTIRVHTETSETKGEGKPMDESDKPDGWVS